MRLRKRDYFTGLLTGALFIPFAVTFMTILHLSFPGKNISNFIFQSQTKSNFAVKPDNICDKTIKTFKPKWADKGWEIGCVDSIGKEGNQIVYGQTEPNNKIIKISREIPYYQLLKHVIVHEYTHAKIADDKLNDKPQWKEWTNYLKTNAPVELTPYLNDPNEIIADNSARCYLDENDLSTLGFPNIDCHIVYKYFPQLKH